MDNATFRERMLRTTHAYVALDEADRMHSFTLTVGRDLIERGILWRDHRGYWRVREKDANDVLANDPDIAVCDFCALRPVVYACDVDDFRDRHHGHSVGGWAACQTCGELVAAGNVEGLFERAAHTQAERLPSVPDAVLTALAEFHELFWAHYRGIKKVEKD